ncbi:MAG: hypothetical protein ACOYJ1_12065 [Peptococcales bacterium]|jgi:hypothetical protein
MKEINSLYDDIKNEKTLIEELLDALGFKMYEDEYEIVWLKHKKHGTLTLHLFTTLLLAGIQLVDFMENEDVVIDHEHQ